jgi:hypothetical protein
MPEILLLIGDTVMARNDNHSRFPAAFERAGWQVTLADHEDLEIQHNQLHVGGRDPLQFDLIWPLGFGRQATFFDRMQLLKSIPGARFVTTPDVLMYLHGKHRWLHAMPETHTSTRPESLFAVLNSGGDWILKPTAGSFGRDVLKIRENEISLERLRALLDAADNGYLIAQRFVPEIQQGEKRSLFAAGHWLGSYLRIPTDAVRSNLTTGGQIAVTQLTSAERRLVEPIAAELADLGAGFTAIDTVYPYLMEVNVANPGGLASIDSLTGIDLSDEAVRRLLSNPSSDSAP